MTCTTVATVLDTHITASMDRVFPHALKPLVEVDPTMADLIVAEKERQWCVAGAHLSGSGPTCQSVVLR